METRDSTAIERAWLEAVGERLAQVTGSSVVAPPSEGEVRLLLRVTKITADVTGVRYLAPLTSYLIGRAQGVVGDACEMRDAVDAIAELAERWIKEPPAD